MKKNKKQFKKISSFKKSGFSLIEVIIALFILTVGILAVMELEVLSYRSSADARDQIVAASLAQDALELVFNVKDNNKFSGGGVDQFQYIPLGLVCIDGTYNYTSGVSIGCSGATQLYFDNANGFVNSSGAGNIATKFFRKIEVINSGTDKIVAAYVSWNNAEPNTAQCNLQTKCVSAQVILTNN